MDRSRQYIRGRKTEAGLTVGLEKVGGIGWVARKGALPSADLSYIFIDNILLMHWMSRLSLGEMG